MPLRIKLLSSATVVFVCGGLILFSLGYDSGLSLVLLPVLIVGLRFQFTRLRGPEPYSIFDYTRAYFVGKVSYSYGVPRWIISAGLFILSFVLLIAVLYFFGLHTEASASRIRLI